MVVMEIMAGYQQPAICIGRSVAEDLLISKEWRGLLFVVLAATLWGVSGSVTKHVFNQQVSPFDLTSIRLFFSFVFLFLYLAATNRPLLRISLPEIPYFLVFGLFGVAILQFTYLFTISQTNVATAVFLEYLAPVLAALYGMVFLRERPHYFKLIALILAVCGGVFIVNGNPGGGLTVNMAGLIGGLASAAAFAFYSIYSKKGLARHNSWTVLTYGTAAGFLWWSFYLPPWQAMAGHSLTNWLFFMYIVVFATILPYGFFIMGLKYLDPVKAGIISTLEPVIAAVVAWIFLHEALFPLQVLGGGLVCAAVILVQATPRQRKSLASETGSR
jgi:drug/metabolite transporter (DMT)-like permease